MTLNITTPWIGRIKRSFLSHPLFFTWHYYKQIPTFFGDSLKWRTYLKIYAGFYPVLNQEHKAVLSFCLFLGIALTFLRHCPFQTDQSKNFAAYFSFKKYILKIQFCSPYCIVPWFHFSCNIMYAEKNNCQISLFIVLGCLLCRLILAPVFIHVKNMPFYPCRNTYQIPEITITPIQEIVWLKMGCFWKPHLYKHTPVKTTFILTCDIDIFVV